MAESRLDRVDRFQAAHPAFGVPLAVYKKYSEDEGGKLAALISYHGFISVFPLLIVLATVVSRVLAGNEELAQQIVTTAAGSFLSIGADGDVQPLDLSGLALGVALLVALWSGLAVANSIQDAMNVVEGVPKTERPGFVQRIRRSVTLLVIVGVGLPATTVLQGLAGRVVGGPLAAVVGWLLVLVLNTLLIGLAFKRATAARKDLRAFLPGAAAAAVAWSLAQDLGAALLSRRVESATPTYGSFALVIGVLFWLYLLAQITVYCAELNAVLEHRLWPRSVHSFLDQKARTVADERAYASYPQREKQATNMSIDVEVASGGGDAGPGWPSDRTADSGAGLTSTPPGGPGSHV